MSAYHYFIATLPGLRWGEAPPMSVAEFLARGAAWVPARDHAALRAAAARDPAVTARPAGARWWRWEQALGNALAGARAARLGREAAPHLRGTEPAEAHVRAAVQEAVKHDDPLKAESALDQLRWQFYEELSAAHTFDFDVALSYLLRLALLERWAQFDPQRGRDMFMHSVESEEERTMRSTAA